MTIKNFVKDNRITLTYKTVDSHPGYDDSHDKNAHHYKVTLHYADTDGERKATFLYTKGSGFKGEAPTAEEVIYSLSSDSNCIVDGLHEFASEFDYDRGTALRIFNQIEENDQKLYKLLGHDKFQDFKTLTEDEEDE